MLAGFTEIFGTGLHSRNPLKASFANLDFLCPSQCSPHTQPTLNTDCPLSEHLPCFAHTNPSIHWTEFMVSLN